MSKKTTGFEKSAAKEEFKTSPIADFTMKRDPLNFAGRDPDRSYKLIDFEAFKKSGFRDYRGWIPLVKTNKTTEKIETPDDMYGVPTDGFLHERDRIIAFMPKERYDGMRAMQQEKTRRKTESAQKAEAVRKMAKRSNIPLFQTE